MQQVLFIVKAALRSATRCSEAGCICAGRVLTGKAISIGRVLSSKTQPCSHPLLGRAKLVMCQFLQGSW